MLSVPALMWLGLPADVANGTSRVAILAQGATGVLAFRRAKAARRIAVVGRRGRPKLDRRDLRRDSRPRWSSSNDVFQVRILICTFVIMAGTLFHFARYARTASRLNA